VVELDGYADHATRRAFIGGRQFVYVDDLNRSWINLNQELLHQSVLGLLKK
jgi:hypothetical protein